MNCVLYARVSTDKQADLSIPAQLEAMRAYAHQKRWLVAEEFVEPGASAKTADRPSLQRLLARIRDSKRKTDVVLVHKIDRLARNVYDHATIKALFTQRHVQLASVVENVDDTVPGQLVENIMASIAQFYSANLADEVKKGMRQKVLKGGWPHLPPRGYVSVKNSNGRGSHVEVQPRQGPLVTQAFELYATGNYSLRTLAQRLAADGLVTKSGAPLPQSQMQRMFVNPFYAGRILWNGLDVAADHRALVSPVVFERVREVIAKRHRGVGVKGSVKGFPLRGTAICADCRGRMTAEQHGKWGYYRCSRQSYKKERCTARFCNANRAHADLRRICQQIQISRSVADAIRERAAQLISSRAATRDDRMAALHTEQITLSRTEMQLTDAFTHGNIEPHAYKERSLRLKSRRAEIERLVGQPPLAAEDVNAGITKILEIATSMWDLYEPVDDTRRSDLLRAVFRTLVLGPEGIIGWSLNPPFDGLQASTNADVPKIAATVLDAIDHLSRLAP